MLRAIVGLAAYRFINSGISRKWTERRKTELLLASSQIISQVPLWADNKVAIWRFKSFVSVQGNIYFFNIRLFRQSRWGVSLMITQTFSGVVQLAAYLRTCRVFWSHKENVGHGKRFACWYWDCLLDRRSCHQIAWCCINRPLMD